ncbi:MAG: helix-turn-helix domain-containing protein [Candidatus Woesearchaeota archaeon]|nr:helix-turn-helix domain-containing protein [Candidatus Woesearchaeota archaeon]
MKLKNISINERIKQIREELNLSQSDFARLLDYDRRRISLVESKGYKRNISFLGVNDIAKKRDLIPVGFYYHEGEALILDTLSSKEFWKDNLKNYIGQIIKKYRTKKEYNQKELAKKANLSYQTISRYESGKEVPTSGNLEKICRALDIEPSYLLEKTVKFDSRDFIPFVKGEFVLRQYLKSSNDLKEIRRIINMADKIGETNISLKKRYNKLVDILIKEMGNEVEVVDRFIV